MFTGIVEETGMVRGIKPTGKSIELTVAARVCARGLKLGDSIAVNGCCLTAVKMSGRGAARSIRFDLLQETWDRTNLSHVSVGSLVNLERALPADGRLGGHFVTGHVDGVGKIVRWERSGKDHLLDIRPPKELLRQMVFKGSIAVDGISLTVAAVDRTTFRIWIIPHTLEVTNLRNHKVGAMVNLETDLLGKYVERILDTRK
ncbi:MAG TPA: riboflavin synthase [Roseimicrobium sp.]|nr:riboflavin synthase [Roseimicrobium sp.]